MIERSLAIRPTGVAGLKSRAMKRGRSAEQHRRAAERGADHVLDSAEIGSELDRECGCLRRGHGVHGDEVLVDELDHLTRADAAAEPDLAAERLEHRECAIERRLIAPDHHRQRSGLGAGRTARYRRIEEARALASQGFRRSDG